MKKGLLIVMASMLFMGIAHAQNSIWNTTDGKGIPQSALLNRASVPSQYTLFHLDLPALKTQLANAPLRGSQQLSQVVVQFPDGNGQLKNFTIYEAPVMQPGLSAKYPDMKSYVGQGADNPSEAIRFSITRYGLHTMLSTAEGTAYTDPYTKDGLTAIAYKRSAVTPRAFRCDVTDVAPKKKSNGSEFQTLSVPATDGELRTYRLALSCTIEYAAFHIEEADATGATLAEQKAVVLAAMVVTVTRVNSVYERDFAISLQLIDNNADLIFITSDTYDNENNNNALLNQSQGVIDGIVGFNSYDIGHVASTGGGGVAQLYSPCSNSKARGITGLFAPVGDPYDIDFVAHEMGHQFGGNHTFNNDCDGNRNEGTAYETGSGTTIMAYAGVCFPSVQDHSDAHFHRISIEEITDFMKDGGNCSVNTVTGNDAPVANAGPDRTIPKGTPFILKATGTDANSDALTYCWEQMDLEITEQPPLPTATEGPNFRSLPPANSPNRYMPVLNAVLANNLAPTWEVVSTVARDFNFVVTVRDNNPLGGQTSYDDMQVHVSGTAGPFLVTSPNTNVSWQAGSNQNVTWDVAGTTANGVNAAYVDIMMSNDGGQTYPVALASKVPNDGSEVITVPVGNGSNKRIMVRGYDHIFYDLSNTNFTVTSAPSTMAIAVASVQNQGACKNSEVTYDLSYLVLSGFTGTATFAVTGNPAGSVVSFSPETATASGTVTLTVTVPETVAAGFYTMAVTATSGAVTKTANLYLEVVDTSFGTVTLIAPADDAETVISNVNFKWDAVTGATSYQLEVATDADFNTIVVDAMATANNYVATVADDTEYFWRVRPLNTTCAGAPSAVFTFSTAVTACSEFASNVPVIISGDVTGTINSTLAVTGTDPISKVSVAVNISHTWVGDLTAVLKSPNGTLVTLFQNECGQDADNVNATFDDYGNTYECGANPAISGFLLPQTALSAFNGQSPQGIWTLSVTDNFEQDGGQLNSWKLTLCNTEEVIITGVKEQSFAGLTVAPNPNTGNFTVKFTSGTGNDIKISVYDIRGRQLLNQAFANTGLIEQPLSLGNVQAGVYLVNIQDGDSTVTKKIIIQ